MTSGTVAPRCDSSSSERTAPSKTSMDEDIRAVSLCFFSLVGTLSAHDTATAAVRRWFRPFLGWAGLELQVRFHRFHGRRGLAAGRLHGGHPPLQCLIAGRTRARERCASRSQTLVHAVSELREDLVGVRRRWLGSRFGRRCRGRRRRRRRDGLWRRLWRRLSRFSTLFNLFVNHVQSILTHSLVNRYCFCRVGFTASNL